MSENSPLVLIQSCVFSIMFLMTTVVIGIALAMFSRSRHQKKVLAVLIGCVFSYIEMFFLFLQYANIVFENMMVIILVNDLLFLTLLLVNIIVDWPRILTNLMEMMFFWSSFLTIIMILIIFFGGGGGVRLVFYLTAVICLLRYLFGYFVAVNLLIENEKK